MSLDPFARSWPQDEIVDHETYPNLDSESFGNSNHLRSPTNLFPRPLRGMSMELPYVVRCLHHERMISQLIS